jgi:hypothetical protein
LVGFAFDVQRRGNALQPAPLACIWRTGEETRAQAVFGEALRVESRPARLA